LKRKLLQALILSLILIGAALAADHAAPGAGISGCEDGPAMGSNASVPENAPGDMHGSWKINLAGANITMALKQSGDEISGQCKFEGKEPWNGMIAGSVSGRPVWIAKAALKGRVFAAA
jgi:hypothetical protein